mmetsp:Transcript_26514/g.56972  ORF Transcript_26514/g.56972 Transcript_26514/m.56972 type:complete len:946 (-) Transcript_26514:237-3074(-)|eukprot:CAMPEP_0172316156 /NCGR_PEP_ID=MMETSP1058-20130122/27482_1 /TAXON_ID=83371 /ORGANISM="Detonula confervacea, Strain CCMP 353" /LENGTH=945 /DNA_ID=CAMNT_0013030413 /DNA_START=118 /DNA_END=2955 /DNA_ORIENTATION=+
MMKCTQQLLVLLFAASSPNNYCHAFSTPVASSSRTASATTAASAVQLAAEPPTGGISATVVEEEDVDSEVVAVTAAGTAASSSSSSSSSSVSATKRVGINSRGAKMNEIDFTLAPTDVSLSRSYQKIKVMGMTAQTSQSLSLTRALNTASNRAVRRILLSRSWPSAEALNLSLRTVLMQQQQKEEIAKAGLMEEDNDKAKCPVPRPILNILMNRRGEPDTSNSSSSGTAEERERLWIKNQIADFRESYRETPNYNQAEAYLESVLSLATSGTESERVADVMWGGMYVDPYVRILSVIQSVGAVLEEAPDEGGSGSSTLRRIAKKLIDQDICLSMLDKISLANERNRNDIEDGGKERPNPVAIPYDAAAQLAYDADSSNQSMSFDEFKVKYVSDTVAMVSLKKKQRDEDEKSSIEEAKKETKDEPKRESRLRRLAFWSRDRKSSKGEETKIEASNVDTPPATVSSDDIESSSSPTPAIVINPDDLGGVLLSAEEPTMTRQLNVLSNIIQRTLIFGGDQELLVLSETLDADKPAFIQRWYKNDPAEDTDIHTETRPGVQYLNSLIQILRDCYTNGVIEDVTPTLPLTKGYQNAYGRLTASLIELGSGYVRPSSSSALSLSTAATAKYLTSMAPPKSPIEELGRFASWESAVRKNLDNGENPHPDDLVGTWSVQDVVGTQTIGTTDVVFKPQGEVTVKPPMQGLRWRLDPGPTHLDTCTFQVLSDDGAILQYKGFVDRGSRLEARVSKRSVTMRGGVSFLMRDAEGGNVGNGYWDDMVPMNFNSGTTKFIMSRNKNDRDGGSSATASSQASTAGLQAALKCPPVAEGEREILNGPNGPILVTKVAGSYYAIDATCPHLNLPMKKGKISVEEGKPTLTCSFHNSCFEMKTGKCTKWVTGALGSENEFISGVMSNLGSEQKDIVAYQVSEEEDGTLTVTSEIPEISKIAA